MRIANANGTITIVTNIDAKELKEPQKVYDRHNNEVYCIRKAAKGEAGGFNKVSAVLNGVVNGKAALIIIKSDDFDYEAFKAEKADAMAMFYEAEKVVAESLSVHKTRVERMWDEIEGSDLCAAPAGTCACACESDIPTCEPVDTDEVEAIDPVVAETMM